MFAYEFHAVPSADTLRYWRDGCDAITAECAEKTAQVDFAQSLYDAARGMCTELIPDKKSKATVRTESPLLSVLERRLVGGGKSDVDVARGRLLQLLTRDVPCSHIVVFHMTLRDLTGRLALVLDEKREVRNRKSEYLESVPDTYHDLDVPRRGDTTVTEDNNVREDLTALAHEDNSDLTRFDNNTQLVIPDGTEERWHDIVATHTPILDEASFLEIIRMVKAQKNTKRHFFDF